MVVTETYHKESKFGFGDIVRASTNASNDVKHFADNHDMTVVKIVVQENNSGQKYFKHLMENHKGEREYLSVNDIMLITNNGGIHERFSFDVEKHSMFNEGDDVFHTQFYYSAYHSIPCKVIEVRRVGQDYNVGFNYLVEYNDETRKIALESQLTKEQKYR